MKRLVATLSLAALATGAWAQGFVTIANSTFPVYIGPGTNRTGTAANSFYYDVLINASTVTTIDPSLQGLAGAGWSDSGVRGVNGTAPGTITAVNLVATGWASGTFDSAVVVGWSANLGTTWAQAEVAITGAHLTTGSGANAGWTGGTLAVGEYVGYTTIAQAIAGQDAGTAAALFSTGATAQVPTPISTSTFLYPAASPEPGTLAFAGLGVASLLVFRRRK